MKTLAILGAGQYGQVVKEVALCSKAFDNIVFLDDKSPLASGKLDQLSCTQHDCAFVAIGNVNKRRELLGTIDKPTTLIHPSSTVMQSAVLGKNVIVEAGAVVCSGAKIGDGCIIMANAVVGHNAVVGDFCQIKYNCTIVDGATVPSATILDCNTVFKVQ